MVLRSSAPRYFACILFFCIARILILLHMQKRSLSAVWNACVCVCVLLVFQYLNLLFLLYVSYFNRLLRCGRGVVAEKINVNNCAHMCDMLILQRHICLALKTHKFKCDHHITESVRIVFEFFFLSKLWAVIECEQNGQIYWDLYSCKSFI